MMLNRNSGFHGQPMNFIQIYFFLGSVMVLVVLWDFKTVPKTAKRFVTELTDKDKGFAAITKVIRNMVVMAAFALFAWPVIILWEAFGKDIK